MDEQQTRAALRSVGHLGLDPRTAPLPRDRDLIRSEARLGAAQDDAHTLALLQIEVMLDVRDLLGECAVRLSEIAGEGGR